jgi:nucleotide-binding universal stress UspA family protein
MGGGNVTRIVVGYDASPDAERAVEWAVSTARLSGQRVELVIAVSAMDPVLSDFRQINEHIAEERHARAAQSLRSAGCIDAEVTLTHGNTVPVLITASRSADLLVVGSRGHSLAGGTFGGSISQHVARHAACPVVVVREPGLARANTIVAGVDGSEESIAAVRFAIGRAAATGERVRAIFAYPAHPLPDWERERHHHVASRRDTATAHLDRWLAESRSGLPDVAVLPEAVAGPAAPALVERSAAASLAVVGSRGRDAFAELLLGSTSQDVLRSAHCPVAVVR